MLNRGTVWLLVGAIALGGGVLLLESQRDESQAADDAADSPQSVRYQTLCKVRARVSFPSPKKTLKA